MFEYFTLGADAPDRFHRDISLSPTDNSFTGPVPPISSHNSCTPSHPEMSATPTYMNEIMRRLRNQTLQTGDDVMGQPEWTSPSDTYPDDEMNFQYTLTRTHHSLPDIHCTSAPRKSPIACKRLKRQLNVQLQSSKTHMRDVKALVEDMIKTNSQCVLREAASRTTNTTSTTTPTTLPTPPLSCTTRTGSATATIDPRIFDEWPPTPDVDEGFHEGDDPEFDKKPLEKFEYRRASAPGGIRKLDFAAECERGVNHIVIGGRVLVRSTPRMRRRRTRPPPASA